METFQNRHPSFDLSRVRSEKAVLELLEAAEPAYHKGRKTVMKAISQSQGDLGPYVERIIADFHLGPISIFMIAPPHILLAAVPHF